MPRYDYFCDANAETIEVIHRIGDTVANWGDLCARADRPVGDTDPTAPVRKIFTTPPMANTPTGDADLKNMGFTKLVKRSDGTYENVTRTGTESRFVNPGDKSTMPHLHKKLSD